MSDMSHAHPVNRAQQGRKHKGRTRVQENACPKHVLPYRQKPDDLDRNQNQQTMNTRLDRRMNVGLLPTSIRRHKRIVMRRLDLNSHGYLLRFRRRGARHVHRPSTSRTFNRKPCRPFVDHNAFPAFVTGNGNVHRSGHRLRESAHQKDQRFPHMICGIVGVPMLHVNYAIPQPTF
jgi:hypothetical protein